MKPQRHGDTEEYPINKKIFFSLNFLVLSFSVSLCLCGCFEQ
jgi:hypothetical protein